jgi:hypothetical protein
MKQATPAPQQIDAARQDYRAGVALARTLRGEAMVLALSLAWNDLIAAIGLTAARRAIEQ